MVYPQILYRIGALSLFPGSGRPCWLVSLLVCPLFSTLKSNGQTERTNQFIETVNMYDVTEPVFLEYPAALDWVYGELPRLLLGYITLWMLWGFPKPSLLSGAASALRVGPALTCSKPALKLRGSLTRSALRLHTTVGQRVWLSIGDIPQHVESHKLVSRFIRLFPITRIISPTAVRLKLPATMWRMHPTFHVSKIKPSVTHPLCPAPSPPLPTRLVDGSDVFTVKKLLDFVKWGKDYSTWTIGRATALQKGVGSCPGLSWTSSSSETLKLRDPIHHVERQGALVERGGLWHSDNSFCISHVISSIIYHCLYYLIFICGYISYSLTIVNYISSCIVFCVVIVSFSVFIVNCYLVSRVTRLSHVTLAYLFYS